MIYESLLCTTAVSDGVLWALDGTSFQRIVTRESFRMRQMYEQLLSNHSIMMNN